MKKTDFLKTYQKEPDCPVVSEEQCCGQRPDPVGTFFGYLYKAVTGTLSLLKGLSVTTSYFFNPTRIVTEQYPENRSELKMHERFRGEIIMPHDQEGEHNCTACLLCEKACPNGTISILPTKSISGTRVLGRFVYRLGQCTLCGLCVETCPFDAIRIGQGFERATADCKDLEYTLNRKEGRS